MIFTKFLKKGEKFLTVALKSRIIIVALQKSLVGMILGDKQLMRLLFKSKGIDKFVVFLKIMRVAEK